MADTVKPIRIEGAALLDYQRAKGLISKKARKPHTMTRKKRQDDMEGGFDSPSNSPPGPSIDYRQINVSRTGAAASPMTSTKIGGADAPPKGGADPLPKGGSVVTQKDENSIQLKNGGIAEKVSTNTTPLTPLPKTVIPNVKGGALITSPGHMPNTPITSPLPPAMEAAKEAGTLPPSPPPPQEGAKAQGGAKAQEGAKVELAPPKKKGTRHGIVLAPPRESKKKHVRGHTRKIRVQLSNMKRRLHTAKVIHRQSSEKPIGEVRKLLEDAKLIKGGKASVPESLLRNMYRDYLVLRSKAL